jgi:hypothetical protein
LPEDDKVYLASLHLPEHSVVLFSPDLQQSASDLPLQHFDFTSTAS